ncbi:MAG: 2-octaprenyl-6-methoxyphenyl hydroxylase [Alphaproteobacteria bacterium]|nr:2-octaprenyl-6-methoxyphenyl hydroxylase [Alphaproteobacteria bacterium]
MDRTVESEVLIVGGGPAGLTLALALDGIGIETVVIDRAAPAPRRKAAFDGRAFSIAWTSHRLLHGIGLWRHLAGRAGPIQEIRVADQASSLFLHFDHREIGDHPLGFMVEATDLRRALDREAAGRRRIALIAPMALAELTRGDDGVTARLADGRVIRARLAVAADGRDSETRRQAGIRTVGWSYGQHGLVTAIAHERDHEGIAVEHFQAPGPFALLPLAGGKRSSLVWTERSDTAPAFLALDDAAWQAEIERRVGDGLGRIRPIARRWGYPLILRHALRYVDRRLALIGDAAHAMHPLAGQGLNVGFRDIAVLAELLDQARGRGEDFGSPELLRRYERWRRVDALTLLAVTDGLNRLFSNSVPPLRLARDLGLAAVNRIPPLRRFFMRHAMGAIGKLPALLRA